MKIAVDEGGSTFVMIHKAFICLQDYVRIKLWRSIFISLTLVPGHVDIKLFTHVDYTASYISAA